MRGDRIHGPIAGDELESLLERLRDADLNFRPPTSAELASEGWQIDEYWTDLPCEPPGPPVPGGPWEVARDAAMAYSVADPAVVRAAWARDEPLADRTMLLEGRFLWMRFRLGVRTQAVVDEVREVDHQEVRVWRWSYRTLEGHLEKGQMDYEVWKWLASGRVGFRMHAYSLPAHIPSRLVRLGFALFGRHMQKRFARQALRRMGQIVEAEQAILR